MEKVSWVVLALSLVTVSASAAEPRIFIMGVWPNRMRLFDEKTEEFVGEFPLRHGAVTSYGVTAHTPDFRRLFVVTDRMETVEVIDTARQEVVDELKLSTPEKRVRIFSVTPDPTGKLLYLQASGVELEIDRFTPEEYDLILYDLEADGVKATVRMPDGIELGFFQKLYVSEDGESLFVIGEEVWELNTDTHEIVDTIRWSRPRAAGYGGVDGVTLTETAPGVFQGIYRTTEPIQQKAMSGIVRLDLRTGDVDTFELGPALNASVFAISSDGKMAFAGLSELAAIDLEAERVVARKEGFERGRENNALIVSADGRKLYVTGVGNAIEIYDAESFEKIRSIFVGADIMSPAFPLPRASVEGR